MCFHEKVMLDLYKNQCVCINCMILKAPRRTLNSLIHQRKFIIKSIGFENMLELECHFCMKKQIVWIYIYWLLRGHDQFSTINSNFCLVSPGGVIPNHTSPLTFSILTPLLSKFIPPGWTINGGAGRGLIRSCGYYGYDFLCCPGQLSRQHVVVSSLSTKG